jgi:hypothetical protein
MGTGGTNAATPINIAKKGMKRMAKDSKYKEPQNLPHDLNTETSIIKFSQKRQSNILKCFLFIYRGYK